MLRQRSADAGRFTNIGEPSNTRGRLEAKRVCFLPVLPALVSFHRGKETCSMLTNFPVFHAEYWVYALAGLVVIVVGTLLYTVEAPIKFSSWF